jgi:antitoxin component YwqK of YwqJK toxin-antitoxin module
VHQESYDDDGFILSETAWQSGKRHGKSVAYWITGAVRSEGTFDEGNGKLTGYFPGGQKQFEEQYVNDRKVGKQIYWHENGQKRLECTINEAGRYDGCYIYFHQNGQKAFQLEYDNGRILWLINSAAIAYDANGRIMKECVFEPDYRNGKIVGFRPKGASSWELPAEGLMFFHDPSSGQDVPEVSFAISGPCEYMEIPGTARITAIKPAGAGYNCPRNPVEVLFDFTPDDPKRSSKCVHDRHLTIGAGMNPSLDFVENRGLKVGQPLRCIRKEIITGTCTPTGFDFPDVNLSDYGKWCF